MQFNQKVNCDELLALVAAGKGRDEIAVHFGVTRDGVNRAAHRLGVQLNKEVNKNAGVTKLDLEQLKQLWAEGMPVADIGLVIGCNASTVSSWAGRLGLPRRVREYGKPSVQITTPPRREKPGPDLATMTGRLLATKGRYEAIEAIRKAEGWTPAQAMQRYHAARAGR